MKETPMHFRVERDLKESFIQACRANDTTAARELRLFMRDYLKRNGQVDAFSTGRKK